ncbi:MAG: tetraacyldisaccharide 4'-kinase [Dialister sp.]|nr:tetraacyldisaccharide 4'-kinase [Dialister sp.]
MIHDERAALKKGNQSAERKLEAYALSAMSGKNTSCIAAGLRKIMSSLEVFYKKGVLFRKEKETASARDAGLPVISVGNITTGGTGKTPCIIRLAQMLMQEGYHPAIISRGYGGQMEHDGGVVSNGEDLLASPESAGDEPYMIAARLPGVPVLVGKDRVKSAERGKWLGVDVLLLDDGFQYWKMKRDLDIVLIDGTNPFGYGHVLPRGLLREPLEGLARADVFIITKSDLIADGQLTKITETLAQYNSAAPVLKAIHKPMGVLPFGDWQERNEAALILPDRSPQYILVTALGNPASVEESVKKMGYPLLACRDYPDHYKFREKDILSLWEMACREYSKYFGAGGEDFSDKDLSEQGRLLITEKDAVKMIHLKQTRALKMGIDVFLMEFSFVDEGEEGIKQRWEAFL